MSCEQYVTLFGHFTDECPWGVGVLQGMIELWRARNHPQTWMTDRADEVGVGWFLAPAHFSRLGAAQPTGEFDNMWYPTVYFVIKNVWHIKCIYILVNGTPYWVTVCARVRIVRRLV